MSGEGTQVGIQEGVGGELSGDDDVVGEPDGKAGGDDGFGCVGQVIFIYPYVPPPANAFQCEVAHSLAGYEA